MSKVGSKRTGKQCRTRWLNHLDPTINKGVWTKEEERTIYEAQRKLGNKWADIAKYLAGRTDFLIHVAVRDVGHLRDFAVDAVAARAQVAEVETQIVFEHRRRHGWPRYR